MENLMLINFYKRTKTLDDSRENLQHQHGIFKESIIT